MTQSLQILKAHPAATPQTLDAISACITALHQCVQSCTSCADADLSGSDMQSLVHCARLNLDCADVCAATARLLSRPSMEAADIWVSQLEACITACRLCGDECARHARHHEHCAICADICRDCEQTCQKVLGLARKAPARQAH